MAAGNVTRCAANSFRFNGTLCVCDPGYVMDSTGSRCALFEASPDEWMISSGIDYSLRFPATLVSFDSITKITNSQALFLEAVLVTVLSWLLFCAAVRFASFDDRESIWFKIRWWISRLDFVYASEHWLEDQKPVKKRKTELGGAFSFASLIMFIGLVATLFYQIIAKRSMEVHNMTPTNASELKAFLNDMELNITTISSMSCSNLRMPDTLLESRGSVDYRVSSLSVFAHYSCYNTSKGPTITMKCTGCRMLHNDAYISWHFVDLPDSPAMAVAFHFNFSARGPGDYKHVSFVRGTLRNERSAVEVPSTFRGPAENILHFHFFPRLYHNFHGLRLIQPLFHGFLPGSSTFKRSQLQASLQNPEDGIINMTLHVKFISDFIIEIYSQNVLGPVGFLANVGGLYAFCIATFFYFLLLFEHRIKKLRCEDSAMQNIRRRKRAQMHWDKVRKYVAYTWGARQLDDESNRHWAISLVDRSMHKRKKTIDPIFFDKAPESVTERNIFTEDGCTKEISLVNNSHCCKNDVSGEIAKASKQQLQLAEDVSSWLPPVPELKGAPGIDIMTLSKFLRELLGCSVHFSERIAAAEALLQHLSVNTALQPKDAPHSQKN